VICIFGKGAKRLQQKLLTLPREGSALAGSCLTVAVDKDAGMGRDIMAADNTCTATAMTRS
jgi:hypothetical protein